MNRRKALKNIGLSFGVVVSAPTMLGLLQSCQSDTASQKYLFFSDKEGQILTQLADLILPHTDDMPGALDLHIPQAIDLYFQKVADETQQQNMKADFLHFQTFFETTYKQKAEKGTAENYTHLLRKVFVESEKETPSKAEKKAFNFIRSIRSFTINAFVVTEEIGTKFLNYDPTPAVYQGCVPLDDIKIRWSF